MQGYFESFIGVNFWTALFTLLNFLLLFFVARKYLIGPLLKLITARQQEIDGMYADAGNAKADAEAMQTAYRAKLQDAQATSDRIVQEAVLRAQAREEEILRRADEKAAAMLGKATQDIAREKEKAVTDAKQEISGIAIVLTEKMLGRVLSTADQNRLFDDFLNRLEDAP